MSIRVNPWLKKEPSSAPGKALDSTGSYGHKGSYIQSELDNPIYAAGNPRITSNPKPSGWGASPHRWAKKIIRTSPDFRHCHITMSRTEALKNEVLGLNDHERASLASDLLYSLPATLQDEDDGLAEALRRDRELSESDSCSVSWDDLKRSVGR